MKTSGSPYKFLDSYEPSDRDAFFGRQRETEILVSDIILSRLVVLFAKTGTGKTSLINAAVRPALEQRGFVTFFVRVRQDPTASAREELAADSRVGDFATTSLRDLLKRAAERIKAPLVVIFDQFEEFFLYQLPEQPVKARSFIADLAALYRNRSLGVHIVLSMREDFYVELDAFRDEIPTIFHNDSNLRLRWFEREQARDAIVKPLALRGIAIEEQLVERLLDDLALRRSLVEPAQLQIVSDTLWRESRNGAITLGTYTRLGTEQSSATVAEQIVGRRLVEQFEAFESQADLAVVERLLAPGVLSTERGTKYVRDLPSLARDLSDVLSLIGGDEGILRVLQQLEQSRLVRLFVRDDLPVRRAHARLSGRRSRATRRAASQRAEHLAAAGAGPRASRMEPCRSRRERGSRPRRRPQTRRRRVGGAACAIPRRAVDHLLLTRADAELLLRVAIHRGGQALPAYQIALGHGVGAWEIVATIARGPETEDAVSSIGLLRQLGTAPAVSLLEELLADERLATEAQQTLTAIGHDPQSPAATAALEAVIRYLKRLLTMPSLAPRALNDLARLDSVNAVDVIADALAVSGLASDAENALRQAAWSSAAPVAQRARSALVEHNRSAAPVAPARMPRDPWRETAAVVRQATPSGNVDETHFDVLIKSMYEGRVALILGSDINAAGRSAGPGSAESHLPTHAEVAYRLSELMQVTADGPDLAAVAQATSALVGEGGLHDALHEILAVEPSPTVLHRFVARLHMSFERSGFVRPVPVIVTTAYDDALERAFLDSGEPYDLVVWHRDTSAPGRFVHKPWEQEPIVIEDARSYQSLPTGERTVIFKPLGTVDTHDRYRPALLVTEDDFLDFLADPGLSSLVPVQLAATLQRSEVLYLGCSVRSWSQRAIISRLLPDRYSRYRTWAVSESPDALERALWEQRGVKILTANLAEYVHAFETRIGVGI